eukprot:gene16459-22450_t
MDSKQYQRAVTPTIETSVGSVRGKLLAYNNPSNINNTNNLNNINNININGNNSMKNKSLKVDKSTASSSNNSRGIITSPRGTMTGGSLNAATNEINVQGKSTNYRGLATIGQNEQVSQSLLSKYDLIPISEDIPADGIIFARLRNQNDVLVVCRTPEERIRNPERLNLDRRQLEVCPLLEQEQRLRLLNFQNNSIRCIQNLENLPNLIFLDLYNNKITSLDGPLSMVKGLRVLMAGKNKISSISNLTTLRKLDVLDLHSNDIKIIEGLDSLSDLRVLNLAGNKISSVNNLSSLISLTELNLRRNCIDVVIGLHKLPALQRVFLSHNLIRSMNDIACLFDISFLIELSLDGNPVSNDNPINYRNNIIVGMAGLRHLDLKRITEEERANANTMIQSEQIMNNNNLDFIVKSLEKDLTIIGLSDEKKMKTINNNVHINDDTGALPPPFPKSLSSDPFDLPISSEEMASAHNNNNNNNQSTQQNKWNITIPSLGSNNNNKTAVDVNETVGISQVNQISSFATPSSNHNANNYSNSGKYESNSLSELARQGKLSSKQSVFDLE